MVKSKYLDFKVIRKHAREFRNNKKDSDKLLWKQLRNQQLLGTVIELDGPIHQHTEEFDWFRDIEMNEKGIHVLD
jgi:very-short-patch-repair endonuclease